MIKLYLFYIIQDIKELDNELIIEDLKDNLKDYNNFMTDLDKIFNNENIVLDYEKLIKRHKYIFNNKFEIPRLSRDNNYIYQLHSLKN